MVGANCSILGFSSSRKKSGVAIFKVTQGDDEQSSSWSKNIISIVIKGRVIDKALGNKIMKKKFFFVTEKHYSEDHLIRCMYKIIISLFLQKSLKVSCNAGKQLYYKLRKRLCPFFFSSLEQLCQNINPNFVLRNARDLLRYTAKKLLLKSLATLFTFMCKILNFYWLWVIAFLLRNNEQFKTSRTKKQRKFKNKKIQRKFTVSVITTRLEPTTTQFINKHSNTYPNWPNVLFLLIKEMQCF